MIQREANFTAKRERRSTDNGNTSKASSSAATASWSRFKDPRIVRVSRALGGKDRHSKVCTVRGLRDRRVRLSVPTAIQLYDLQDRLGLNQPSKVVDWLLNVAKNEIDELPPLQIPQGSFINQSLNPFLNHHEFIVAASQSAEKQGLKISADFSWNDPLKHGHPPTGFDGKSKDVERNDEHHQSWTRNQEKRQFNLDQNQGGGGDNDDDDQYVSTNNFFSRESNNPSSFPSLISATMAPFNSFMRWDPSNLTLSHPPISLGLTAQHDQDLHNCSLVQLPPTMSIHQAASHQVLVYQPAGGMSTTQPHFPSQISPTNVAIDLSNSSAHGLPVRQPLQFNMTADLLPSNEQTKHDELHSS